jgi:hypothetical protein
VGVVARWLVAVAVAGCTEEIVGGAYLCGPEQLCPDGLVCNGTDNLCVDELDAQPFACAVADPAGDDAPATGRSMGELDCVSATAERSGCLLDGDPADWFQVDAPGRCTAVQVEARVTFPIAFEPLELAYAAGEAAPVPVDQPCPPTVFPATGDEQRCFTMVVAPGSRHGLGVIHAGRASCDGGCAFNRYRFTVRLR